MKNKIFLIIALFFFLLMYGGIAAEEKTVAATPQKTPAPNTQNNISLDVKGMDVVDVLKMLASRSGMNIVVGKNVTGKVTLFLKNVDINDAFEIILLANDLAYETKGNIINVMTQRDYELLYGTRFQDKKQAKVIQLKYARAIDVSRALNQIKTSTGKVVVDEGSNTIALIDAPESLAKMEEFIRTVDLPMQTMVFSLNYSQADKIQPKLQEIITKGVGSLKIDERTNKIVVTDYPQKLDEITKIIGAFDEKTQQVLIDAQIIEIRPSDKFEMGVDWEYWIEKHFKITNALPIGTAGRMLLGTANVTPTGAGQYKAILDLLRTVGDTKILSSPRIMAIHNQEARILVGKKEAYITSTVSQSGDTAITSQAVNFVDTGIKLYVTPLINHDGFVTMKIRPEVSSAETISLKSEDKETQVPIVSTSEAETTVMVKDGVTIIIGGLRKDEKIKTEKRIPLLADIPLIGIAFRNKTEEIKKTELIILLTPHIMSGEDAFTNFSELKPKEGAIAKMVDGEIVTEKVSSSEQQKKNMTASDYYRLITNRIDRFAKLYSPKSEKGEITLKFNLSSNGHLTHDPEVVETSSSFLNYFAIKAIKDASPFPPFPDSLEAKNEPVSLTISLSYK